MDFSFTVIGLHILFTSLLSHRIPASAFWWGTQLVTALVTWGVGLWLTRWWELRPIEGFGSGAGGGAGGGKGGGKQREEEEGLMNGHAGEGVELREMER